MRFSVNQLQRKIFLMVLRTQVLIVRRVVLAVVVGVLVGVSPMVQHTPAYADGTSWTPVLAAEANYWQSVAYGNGVWVAVSDDGTNRVMRSTDNGVTWTRVLAAQANLWTSVAYEIGRASCRERV